MRSATSSPDSPDAAPAEFDVAVIGGSAAGLAAALQVQRQRRRVVVIDSGEPRNAPAAHMHGYLGFDGAPPSELVSKGRAEVEAYGAEVRAATVQSVRQEADGFVVSGADVNVRTRRVIAATGATDELPPIDGALRHWGRGVLHCPFCHGHEVAGRRIAQFVTHSVSLHPGRLFAHLAGSLRLIVSQEADVDEEQLAPFRAAGAEVLGGDVIRITEASDGSLAGVELADGTTVEAEALVVTPYLRPRIDPFADLGIVAEPHPIGVADIVATDETGQTSVAGFYAAGNLTDPSLQVLGAAADGSRVGAMVAIDLAAEDQAVRLRT